MFTGLLLNRFFFRSVKAKPGLNLFLRGKKLMDLLKLLSGNVIPALEREAAVSINGLK